MNMMALPFKLGRTKTVTIGYYPRTGPFAGTPPALEAALAWWLDFNQKHPKPSKKNLEFKDLRGWHSQMTLARLNDDYSDMTAIIVGQSVSEIFDGALSKGSSFLEVTQVGPEAHINHLKKIAVERCIAITSGNFEDNTRKGTDFFAADFPLFGYDCDETSEILTLYHICR